MPYFGCGSGQIDAYSRWVLDNFEANRDAVFFLIRAQGQTRQASYRRGTDKANLLPVLDKDAAPFTNDDAFGIFPGHVGDFLFSGGCDI